MRKKQRVLEMSTRPSASQIIFRTLVPCAVGFFLALDFTDDLHAAFPCLFGCLGESFGIGVQLVTVLMLTLLIDRGTAVTMAAISRPRHYAIETLYWVALILPFVLLVSVLSLLALPFYWIMIWWMQTFVRPLFDYLHSLQLQRNLIFMLLIPMSVPVVLLPFLPGQIVKRFNLWKDLNCCLEKAVEFGFEAYIEWLDDLVFRLGTR
jgi:hypothetical protein